MRHVRRSLFVGALVALACTSDNAGPGGSGVSRLAFSVQPTSTTAGVVSTPAIQVTAQNVAGDVVTTFAGNVTVAIGTNPGSATLSGTLTVPAVAGVATFSDLRLNKPGTGYTLTAAARGVTGATSTAFSITAGGVSGAQSTVVAAPSQITASSGSSVSPITVTARDSLGNPIASAIVVLAASGTGNALTQPAGQTNASGVATGALSSTAVGAKIVTATIGAVSIQQTDTVTVVAGTATTLAFTTQPTSTGAGAHITPAVQVTARDGFGNTATSFTSSVSVAFGTNPSGGTLSGTLSVNAVSGIATFGDLSVDKVGAGYTLAATSGAPPSATSAGFSVTAGSAAKLAFTVQPSSDTAGTSITPAVQVTAQDAQGNTVQTFTSNITVAIGTNAGGGTLSGTKTVAAVAGAATFANLGIDKVGTGYTLQATSGGLTAATSMTFNVVAGGVARLVFQVQPTDAAAGTTITPAVKVAVEDAGGNLVTTATNNVTLSIAANPGSGTLSGGGSTPASAGVATFAALSINKAGTGYTLRATASGLTPDTSATFDITAGSVSASQSQVSVSDDTIGQCLVSCATGTNATTVTVTVRDAGGNPLGSVPVVLTVSPVPGTHPPDTVRFTNPGPSGSTNGSGVFSAIFNSGVAVTTTIKATAGGALITQQPVVAVMRAILVAGDIADCTKAGDDSTARLLDSLPGVVVADGDAAYPDGTPTNFTQCYDPTWGRHKSRTLPVLGNHEYDSSASASGYFGYFTGAVADPLNTGIGYYSTDVAAWHVVVLNSEPAGTASNQLAWLQGDLAGKNNQCVLAIWHEPLFTSGPSGGAAQTRRLWQALENVGGEIVVNGHDHFYERFTPQDSLGNATATGIREFIAGTGGGETHANFGAIAANDEANDSQNFSRGILRLTLYPASYRWQFIPAQGFGTFTDSGSTACH